MAKSTLQDVIEEAGYEVRSYSGRGMYGEKCLGVDTDDSLGRFCGAVMDEVVKRAAEAAAMGVEEADRVAQDLLAVGAAFRGLHTDALGRGSIFYFQGSEPPEEEIEEEEEEELDEAI